jgi:hypothetical protein
MISPYRIGGVDAPASGRSRIGPDDNFDAERVAYNWLCMCPRKIGFIAGRRFEAFADHNRRIAILYSLIDLILVG